jgi:pimeloyl-ACP methyl ester carboxylesterase
MPSWLRCFVCCKIFRIASTTALQLRSNQMRTASAQPLRSILLLLVFMVLSTGFATESTRQTVDEVAHSGLRVMTSAGTGFLPIYVSSDWSKPQPGVTRAVVIFHGVKRNAAVYFRSASEVVQSAGNAGKGTIVIAPQFLTEEDAAAFHLDQSVLRWHHERWEGGANAVGPAAISSFDAIDAVLAQLADRSRFTGLVQVVLAGHSAGAQVVQRYAVVGRGETMLTKLAVRVRYVIANPSSYVYFSEDRPLNTASFARYTGPCKVFNRWKYGVEEPPPYVDQDSLAGLEERYSHRDVIYLLGTADTDPHHPDLDVSCEGEAEGSNRFARGTAYFAYLKARHPGNFSQRLWEVRGVAHDEREMFHSKCGMQALFDMTGCASAEH